MSLQQQNRNRLPKRGAALDYIRAYRSRKLEHVIGRLETAIATEECGLREIVSFLPFRTGKLLRPLLTLLSCEIVGGRFEDALDYACAVELVHVSSLIFDDLPCMDNADTRRGVPCLHKQFGEGSAVLGGLYYLTKAFELAGGVSSTGRSAIAILTDAIAGDGLIKGQIRDIAGERDSDNVRNLKTTPLLVAAVKLGALAAGAGAQDERPLLEYGKRLGLIFQLRDDVLDGDTAASTQQRAELLADSASRAVIESFGTSDVALTLSAMANYAAARHQ